MAVDRATAPWAVDAPFESGDEHLRVLLGWLHRLLAWRVSVTQHQFGQLADDEYRGLYIPDAEVAILSAGLPSLPADLMERRRHLSLERDAIEDRVAATTGTGAWSLPHVRLGRLFGLSRLERDVLLIALAPEFDLRYERLYAYLQDDVTRRRPTVDLALRLLCETPDEVPMARRAFLPDAPLLRNHLVQLVEDGQRHPSLLARTIKIDDRIVSELLGQPATDGYLEPYVHLERPTRRLDHLILPDELRQRLAQAVGAARDGGLVLALQGSYGSGRRALAEALCGHANLPLLTVDLERMAKGESAAMDCLARVAREATLREAAVLWAGADAVLHGETFLPWRQALAAVLDSFVGTSFLATEQSWEARGALRRARFLRVELPVTTYSEREGIWRQRLGDAGPAEADLQVLASTFRLTGGQIRDAVAMSRSLASWHGRAIQLDDLYMACRAQSSGRLDTLANKIRVTYRWDDIVLPTDQVNQLREISVQVRHRRTVLESWGFDRHLAMGKGVNALFAGQSGTGKTMAAEIIASDLGLEVFKVDLSGVVSKYIGETEKNLDSIFKAAREANAILFFDEADALFGKRSEVKDAHDRYANIEVGYLLQKMEEYDGVVILATNLRKNMDDAFVRRLHMSIDFPFPEEPDRLKIWHRVFPPEAPLDSDVDIEFCARQFKVAGGSIRNIALLAAFLAAEDRGTIGMGHVARAAKREYQKLGKLVTEADFGRYMALARGEAMREDTR